MPVTDLPATATIQAVATTTPRRAHEALGICQFVENPSAPDNAANMLGFATDVDNYVADSRRTRTTPVAANVVRPPRHGKLTEDYPGILTYRPAPGYLGADRVTIVARTGARRIRIEYFLRVVTFVPVDDLRPDMYARGDCPVPARTWIISAPRSPTR